MNCLLGFQRGDWNLGVPKQLVSEFNRFHRAFEVFDVASRFLKFGMPIKICELLLSETMGEEFFSLGLGGHKCDVGELKSSLYRLHAGGWNRPKDGRWS